MANTSSSSKKQPKKSSSSSLLPRPSPPAASSSRSQPSSSSSKTSKLGLAQSLENVPITVNSHIPASPQRTPQKAKSPTVTNEIGTQVEPTTNSLTRSASEENLARSGGGRRNKHVRDSSTTSEGGGRGGDANSVIGSVNSSEKQIQQRRAAAPLRNSESADPIYGKKWSYTNGRHVLSPYYMLLHIINVSFSICWARAFLYLHKTN